MASPKLPASVVRDWESAQKNFEALGKRFPLASGMLADKSVTAAKIADGAVGPAQVTAEIVKRGGLGVALNATGADVSGSFSLPRPSDVLLVYFAGGYVTAPNVLAYFNALLNGVVRGSGPQYFNESGSHRLMGPYAEVVNLPAGSHTVRIAAGGNLSRDLNDTNLVVYVAFG